MVVIKMAFLKHYIDKYTYMLIAGIWSAVASYVTTSVHWSAALITITITVGNLVIAWLALETNANHVAETSTTPPTTS